MITNKPDYLIVGSMKCGTTVLNDFICDHKDVVPSLKKEIHYFSMHHDKGDDWYSSHFKSCINKLTGEASPTYFDMANNKRIPLLIKEKLPDVKILVIVRDPVERAISHYFHYQTVNKLECLRDIGINKFFSLPYRGLSQHGCSFSKYLEHVLSFSLYNEHLVNYMKVFGHENVLVVQNTDLLNKPNETMGQVFGYLGLPNYDSKLFNQFKYSSGGTVKNANSQIVEKLADYLYPDYKKFCNQADIPFKPVYGQPDKKEKTKQNDKEILSPCKSVSVGEDGWLFLVGGPNKVVDFYRGKKIKDSLLKKWHNVIKDRHDKLSKLNIQYIHLWCPNKLSVYSEYYKSDLDCFSDHLLARFSSYGSKEKQEYQECIINPIPYFLKCKEKHDLYWKTDSHWTYHGCYCAYQLICSRLGVPQQKELLDRSFGENSILFDLGSKFDPPIRECGRFYNTIKNAERTYANEIVKYKEFHNLENDPGLHVGSHVIYKNPNSTNDFVVIIFGDSFAEYRGHLLTGMLAETFSETHFIWSNSIDFGYIESIRPDFVITELVERFMTKVPDDKQFSLDKYAEAKLLKYKNKCSC